MSLDPSLEARIDSLLSQLSLKEKVALLSGVDNWRTFAVERLGIRPVIMTDGPHGVRSTHMEGRLDQPATAMPTGIALASTWNPALVERVGAALGAETRALGCDVLLGPCVNIVRSPLAGRNFETYSEDPYLAGEIATAWVKGVQSQGVGASLKHFACNNQEIERMRGNSVVDERTLREIYLPAFEKTVKSAQPWTVMCSYNRLNGAYASQNRTLLTDILRGEWGFEGAVVSDWGANHSTFELIKAGLDIEMPGPARWYGELLLEAVKNWTVDAAVVEQAARRMLRLIARVGKLDDPAALPAGAWDTPDHRALAREAAEEAIILLKNEGGLLPLEDARLACVAVIGPNAAEAVISGGGSSIVDPLYSVSTLEGLRARLGERVSILHEPGCSNQGEDDSDEAGMARAVAAAQQADVAVVCIGMPLLYESEGGDRPHLHLPGRQVELVRRVAQANPRTVVVLTAGAPVSMPWLAEVPAVVHGLYTGQEGGNALAAILCGDVNPSGKLTESLPVRLEDTPAYLDYPGGREVFYGEGIFVGYRYYDMRGAAPLFPFGHGLSYTSFEYSGLEVQSSGKISDPVGVTLSVTNRGARAGKEVVQVYVRDVKSSLPRPVKELKAFEKVALLPGETRTIHFTLDERAFAFYDPTRRGWVVEPGEFEILVGSSSRDSRAAAAFQLG